MIKNIFGWNYPPGAENDPNAPYNQVEVDYCEVINTNNSDQDIIQALINEYNEWQTLTKIPYEVPRQECSDEAYIEKLLEALNEVVEAGYKYGISGDYYCYMLDTDYDPEPDYEDRY